MFISNELRLVMVHECSWYDGFACLIIFGFSDQRPRTVSDIPSWSISIIYWINIYCIYIYILKFLSDILSGICLLLLHSGILFGIYSDILSDIGTAHCDLEFTVAVRQCSLRSGVRCWGKEEGGRKEGRREGGREEGKEEVTLIKSRDPHLAGGEKHHWNNILKSYRCSSRHFRKSMLTFNSHQFPINNRCFPFLMLETHGETHVFFNPWC